MIYSKEISKRLASLRHDRNAREGNALGTAANFGCGSVVRFSLSIDTQSHVVTAVDFSGTGCGFMLAAADCLAESVIRKRLADLHGLAEFDLNEQIKRDLGDIPPERRACVDACIEALRFVFAGFRKKQIEEFQGEKALICTCFGVSEETIETFLSEPGVVATGYFTVDDITRATGAGGGCGSCRMLIQEMLDMRLDTI